MIHNKDYASWLDCPLEFEICALEASAAATVGLCSSSAATGMPPVCRATSHAHATAAIPPPAARQVADAITAANKSLTPLLRMSVFRKNGSGLPPQAPRGNSFIPLPFPVRVGYGGEEGGSQQPRKTTPASCDDMPTALKKPQSSRGHSEY
jgi:hypothetical protein